MVDHYPETKTTPFYNNYKISKCSYFINYVVDYKVHNSQTKTPTNYSSNH